MTRYRLLPRMPDPNRNNVIALTGPEARYTAASALVVHENLDMRRIVRNVLTGHLGIAGVIEAGCLDTAIEKLAVVPGISLLIISPDLRGVVPSVTFPLIHQHFPGIRLAMLSPCKDPFTKFPQLAAGAHGHIDITAGAEELAEALDQVRHGHVAVSSWIPEIWHEQPLAEDESNGDHENPPVHSDGENHHRTH